MKSIRFSAFLLFPFLLALLSPMTCLAADGNCNALFREDANFHYYAGSACVVPRSTPTKAYLDWRAKQLALHRGGDNRYYYEKLRARLEVGKDHRDVFEEDRIGAEISYRWHDGGALEVIIKYGETQPPLAVLDFSQQGSDVRVLDRTLAAKQVSGEHFFHSEAMSEHVARDKSCKPVIYGGGSSGYMSSYKCVYAGKTLLDAYLRVRKEYTRENPKLRATLTAGTNHKDDFDEYETIAYQWHGAKKLVINISTEGSETDWEFTQTEKGVEVVCKYVMTT